jgi:hypothetical protein
VNGAAFPIVKRRRIRHIPRVSDFINHWLRSDESGGEFKRCTQCGCALADTGKPWIVNKEWHRGECVMEYALCHGCREGMIASISEESAAHVRRFFEDHIEPLRWIGQFVENENPETLVEACFACGCNRGEAEGFGISAMFTAPGVLDVGPLPVMICQGCSARMEAGLSKATRESWQRFVDENFPGPPGLDEALPRGRMPAMF